MIVRCNVKQCPYNKASDCMKPLLIIDENGHCNQIWFHGHQKVDAFNPIEDKYKEFPIIEEVEYVECNDDCTDSPTLSVEDSGYGEEDRSTREEIG